MPGIVRVTFFVAAAIIAISLIYYAIANPSITTASSLLSSASFLLAALALITRDDGKVTANEDKPERPDTITPLVQEIARESKGVHVTLREMGRRQVRSEVIAIVGIVTVGCLLTLRRR